MTVTVHKKFPKIPPCVKIACCSSQLIFTFLYAGSSTHKASGKFVSCSHLYFVNFDFHATPQTKI